MTESSLSSEITRMREAEVEQLRAEVARLRAELEKCRDAYKDALRCMKRDSSIINHLQIELNQARDR